METTLAGTPVPTGTMPGTPAPASSIRPGRWAYALAVLVFVAGLALGGVLMMNAIDGIGEGLQRAVVPGETQLILEEAGGYTIFYEYQSTVDARIYATANADVSQLRVAVVSVDAGRAIELTSPGASVEYAYGGHAGTAVLTFTVDEPGAYVLSGRYPPGVDGPEVVLAVGQGMGMQFVGGLLAAIGIPMIGFMLAVAIALAVWMMRRRSRRRLAAEAV